MNKPAFFFLLATLISGAAGFAVASEALAAGAQTLFFAFLVLFVIAMVRKVAEGQ